MAPSLTYVLKRVEEEIAEQRSDLPDALRLREAELTAEQRRMANFVDFIGEARGSQALAKALVETERRVGTLGEEVDGLRCSRDKIFRPPPIEWIKDRLGNLQEVLEQRTAYSAQTLRHLLGPIRLGSRSLRMSGGRSTAPSRQSARSPFSKIAAKAAHLRELGMSDRAIAQALDVSDKTVAKAVDATRGDFG